MPSFHFTYDSFPDATSIDPVLQQLMATAAEAARNLSYAPYSKFQVGAAVLLENDAVVQGSNQENASFPAGICAERVALNSAAVLYPGIKVLTIAIAYTKAHIDAEMADEVLSPCGICRQVISEVYQRQNSPIRLLMSSANGKIIMINDAQNLLPFSFGSHML
ncbi:cytidine deaminase [Taibaiella sp. KBW10]|uniref:cytidine deaminase n=1 Tax=Taibaiella sp. KBW10 TaxID=2153357 RepID=UPI000F5B3BEB|nr:cytidine deaminase [Taibaiella sp. KBW10]RQO31215.1 cytidine deaminase [Taibaiella sp. KBW10]